MAIKFNPFTGTFEFDDNSSGGGSAGYQTPTSGSLFQSTFTWSSAPSVIVVDGKTLQQTNYDGTVNWTGTTTTVLSVQPTFDIFGLATGVFQQPLSGSLNQGTFTWAVAPNVIVVDGVPRQKVSTDGTTNWTGTTTTSLTVYPTFDIFSNS